MVYWDTRLTADKFTPDKYAYNEYENKKQSMTFRHNKMCYDWVTIPRILWLLSFRRAIFASALALPNNVLSSVLKARTPSLWYSTASYSQHAAVVFSFSDDSGVRSFHLPIWISDVIRTMIESWCSRLAQSIRTTRCSRLWRSTGEERSPAIKAHHTYIIRSLFAS